jgi:O-antigen biosynthesis protein
LSENPRVCIVIPTKNEIKRLQTCLHSLLAKTTYRNFEILIIDNGSDDAARAELFAEITRSERIRVVSYPKPFNYSAINNFAVSLTDADFVCLLNDDVEVITAEWLEIMIAHALRPGVGCVGAKLLYYTGRVQHAGVVLGLGGVAGHAFLGMDGNEGGYFGRAVVASNWSALTGACLLVRRSIYLKVGGLDERLAIAFNDIDFCIKVRNAGYRNVLAPNSRLYHYESASRGPEDTPYKLARFAHEVSVMKERHGAALLSDPCYSSHLSLITDFRVRT